MNFTNFNRKYVQNNAWDVSTTLLWEHNNGTVAQIDMYWKITTYSSALKMVLLWIFSSTVLKSKLDSMMKFVNVIYLIIRLGTQIVSCLLKFICATSSVVKQPKNNVKQSGISFQTKSSFN